MLGGYAPTANGTVAQYDIYDQGVDQGVVVADMLLWLRTHDEAGTVVTVAEGDVELFAPVHPDTLAATMVKYRRGVLLGVNLTSCDQNNFPTGWTVTPSCQPDTNEGHVVYLAKINADGSGELVSWGALVPADAAWMKAAPEEWWILLTSADRAKMGEAAFDALAADLAALPGSTGTAPVPPPPAPAPDPGPPVPEPPNPPVPPAPSPIPVPPIDPPVPPVPLPPTHESWWQEVQEWVAAWKAWIINTGGVPVPGDEEVES
jgi:hypothetical protein